MPQLKDIFRREKEEKREIENKVENEDMRTTEIEAAHVQALLKKISEKYRDEIAKASLEIPEELNVEINAENATKGSNAMAGTFELKDGQKVVVESEIDGEVLVKFYSVTNDAETLPVPDESAKPDFELTVNSSGKTEYNLAAGDYFVSSEATAKTTGKIIISAK